MIDCQSCGACCAIEPAPCTEGEAARLPECFVRVGQTERIVQQQGGQCVALLGLIGMSVTCVIYKDRPSCCRAFAAGSGACQEARRRHGMEAAA